MSEPRPESCQHPRSYNAAGLCFTCGEKIGLAINERVRGFLEKHPTIGRASVLELCDYADSLVRVAAGAGDPQEPAWDHPPVCPKCNALMWGEGESRTGVDRQRCKTCGFVRGAGERPRDQFCIADHHWTSGANSCPECGRGECMTSLQAGDRPPAPSDQETGEPQDLFDAINLLLWHEARAAKNRDGNVASALIANRDEARRRLVALYRGAVRPTPRAAPGDTTIDAAVADEEEILASAAIEAQRRGFARLCFDCLQGFNGATCPRCPAMQPGASPAAPQEST